MRTSEKIKIIDNKIEQNKAQYNLHRQTNNISALSSGNISKYEFLTGKDVLPEKDLPKKAAAIKEFKYFSSGNKLKKQTSVAEKQYQIFDNIFEFNKKKEKSKRSRVKSNLVYINYFTFYRYHNINEFAKGSFSSFDLKEFKLKLGTFYYDIKEIKSNNKAREKNLKKQKL